MGFFPAWLAFFCSNLRLPAWSVLTRPQLTRGRVVDDAALGRVEVHSAARAPGHVGQVAEQGADLSVADFRVKFLAVANGVHEVGEVQNVAGRLALGFHFLSGEVVDDVFVSGGHGEGAVVPIKNHKWQRLVLAPEATALVPHGGAVAEIEQCRAGVGGFLVVVEVVASAAISDTLRQIDAESPAGKVKRMHAVVGHLAAAVMPVPMPVVRDKIVLVRAFRCRPLPEVVIEMLGHGHRFSLADGAPAACVETSRSEYPSDDALVHSLYRLDDERVAASLVAHLHEAIVLASGGDHQPRLGGVMAAGLLDVNMLAGLAAENGRRRVPEIRRGDGDGVEVRIVEHAPQIGDAPARRLLALGDDRQAVGGAVVIDVANVDHLNVGEFQVILDVCHAAAKAHHADSQLVGGLVGGVERVALGQGGGGDSSGGVLEETATVEEGVFHFSHEMSGLNLATVLHTWPSNSVFY